MPGEASGHVPAAFGRQGLNAKGGAVARRSAPRPPRPNGGSGAGTRLGAAAPLARLVRRLCRTWQQKAAPARRAPLRNPPHDRAGKLLRPRNCGCGGLAFGATWAASPCRRSQVAQSGPARACRMHSLAFRLGEAAAGGRREEREEGEGAVRPGLSGRWRRGCGRSLDEGPASALPLGHFAALFARDRAMPISIPASCSAARARARPAGHGLAS